MNLIATTGNIIISVMDTPKPKITKNWVMDHTIINGAVTPLWYSLRGRYYYLQIYDKWYKCPLAHNKQKLEWYSFVSQKKTKETN